MNEVMTLGFHYILSSWQIISLGVIPLVRVTIAPRLPCPRGQPAANRHDKQKRMKPLPTAAGGIPDSTGKGEMCVGINTLQKNEGD
jgi:hypothetical protein